MVVRYTPLEERTYCGLGYLVYIIRHTAVVISRTPLAPSDSGQQSLRSNETTKFSLKKKTFFTPLQIFPKENKFQTLILSSADICRRLPQTAHH